MAMILNEEQTMLRDAARNFLASRAPLSHLRELRDGGQEDGYCRKLWQEMADMGWAAIIIPEKWGGLDYGHTGLGLVLEECGRTLTPSPLISTALLGVNALLLSANEGVCSHWLPRIASGEKLLALAFEESSQHRPSTTTTSAQPQDGSYQINGCKQGIILGGSADAFVVSARTRRGENPDEGISLFLVAADAPGLTISTTELLDNHRGATIRMEDVRVDRSHKLGPLHGGWPILEQVLDRGRIGLASELLGIAQETFERTVEYLKERKQFGIPIGAFQALQHRAAILFGEIELCKSVVIKALQAMDEENPDTPILASLAKAKCGQVAELSTAEGIQMHGGIGMTD